MLRRFMTMAALGGLVVAAVGTASAQKEDAGPKDDRDFVQKASIGGSTEVALSKMAEQRATDPEVKSFARKMITDHTAANNELLTLAGRKQLPVPSSVDAKHQEAVDKLGRLQGSDFDHAYMKQMVKDHEETVNLFKSEAEKGQDQDLKAMANRLLPTLQDHLSMAKKMCDKADSKSSTSGSK